MLVCELYGTAFYHMARDITTGGQVTLNFHGDKKEAVFFYGKFNILISIITVLSYILLTHELYI